MLEPVAVSRQVNHLASMQDPVQNGGCDGRIPEQFSPVFRSFVGRQDDGGLPIQFVDQLKEQVSLLPIQRHEHQIVQNHQIGTDDPIQSQLGVSGNLLRLQEMQQLIHRDETDAISLIQCLDAQSNRQMRLPDAWRAQKEQVIMLLQPDQFPKLLQLALSQGRLFVDPKFVQRFQFRERGAFVPTCISSSKITRKNRAFLPIIVRGNFLALFH